MIDEYKDRLRKALAEVLMVDFTIKASEFNSVENFKQVRSALDYALGGLKLAYSRVEKLEVSKDG